MGNRPLRIVGIIADDRGAGRADTPRPLVLIPFAQLPAREFTAYRGLLSYYVVARVADEAGAVLDDPGTLLKGVAPWLVAERPTTMDQAWRAQFADAWRDALHALLVAVLGVSLGLFGLHSALRVRVVSQARDLALIAALGASPWQLCWFGVVRGLACAGLAIVAGMAGVLALVPASPWSWPAAVGAGAGMAALCFVAALPALRLTAATDAWRVVREA